MQNVPAQNLRFDQVKPGCEHLSCGHRPTFIQRKMLGIQQVFRSSDLDLQTPDPGYVLLIDQT